MTPTPELIAEIDALYEKATKGSWSSASGALYAPNHKGIPQNVCDGDSWNVGMRNPNDAKFLAALVNSWPAIKQALSRERGGHFSNGILKRRQSWIATFKSNSAERFPTWTKHCAN